VQTFTRLKWTLPTTFPFSRSMDLPGHTVSLKSEKFVMDLRRLAPALEVAEGHTLPFLEGHGLPILKW
jgi:hypothetical protein